MEQLSCGTTVTDDSSTMSTVQLFYIDQGLLVLVQVVHRTNPSYSVNVPWVMSVVTDAVALTSSVSSTLVPTTSLPSHLKGLKFPRITHSIFVILKYLHRNKIYILKFLDKYNVFWIRYNIIFVYR